MQCVGLYIHIPFCRAKCSYCDFNSFPHLEHLHEPYTRALCSELSSSVGSPEWEVDSVFVGGGTPTVLPPPMLDQVLSTIWQHWACVADVEVTVEANPGTLDREGLLALRRSGVNRLSLGAQSFRESELRLLGRIHRVEQTEEVFRGAREACFENINLDLIYGLPDQCLRDWRFSLERALGLAPEHLSLYALTLEDDTPLQRMIASGTLAAPNPDAAAEMYAYAERRLLSAGYEHYELSNWAVPGRACRHNLKYWQSQPYLGFGAGAHSYVSGRRYQNVAEPLEYVAVVVSGKSPIGSEEWLAAPELMAESMILGLRLIEGVQFQAFAVRHSRDLLEAYASQIAELEQSGLLARDSSRLCLTARGRLLANHAFGRFWPPG